MTTKSYLILVVGPTAVGKTDLCLKLAKKYNTEILSCDSRQFYREMNIGTAKPSPEELAEVKHHFINSLSIQDSYDVRQFEKDAIDNLESIFQKYQVVILTGGSGLYADAVVHGLDDMPSLDPSVRSQIIAEYEVNGLNYLQQEVQLIDPDYYKIVDKQNPQRLMRAIEVWRGTGKTFSSFRIKKNISRPFHTIKIGLERNREELYARIDMRMDQMIADGLFEEAKKLFPHKNLNALQTVGYSEIFGYLEGKYDRDEAIRLLKRNSRRYAKRQLTWFKKDESVHWFSPENQEDIISFLNDQIV